MASYTSSGELLGGWDFLKKFQKQQRKINPTGPTLVQSAISRLGEIPGTRQAPVPASLMAKRISGLGFFSKKKFF